MASWLSRTDGTRLRLDAAGVLAGRAPGCAIALVDPRASGVQALLRQAEGGPELIPLGRNPVRVNDQPASGRQRLRRGDRVDLPGETLTVELDDEEEGWWFLERGGLTCVTRSPTRVGGGPRAHLQIPGWPDEALRLYLLQGALWVEPGVALRVDGREVEAGALLSLRPGATIEAGAGPALTVRGQHPGAAGGTLLERGVSAARLTFMPRGGRLSLTLSGRTHGVDLSELRCRLLAVLLQPGEGLAPGDFVPDEQVLPRVWPREPGRDHYDMNTLIHRLRKALLKAGVPPDHVIERSPQGGATRAVLASGATAEVS
jgi:hypothetical protein